MVLDRPILIGSCGSSGSTLLSVMLHAHPEVLCGPELAMFAHSFFWQETGALWRSRVRRYLEMNDQVMVRPEWRLESGVCPYTTMVYANTLPWYGMTLADLTALVRDCDAGRELADRMYGPLLQAYGKRVWAEKSPPNIYAFRAFLDAYPEGRAVYLVRDGRDVVCSLLKRRWGAVKRAVSAWLVDTAVSESFAGHPRVHRIRYEDLVADPRGTITALLRFLDLSPEVEAVLSYERSSSRALRQDASSLGHPTWGNQPYQAVSTSSVGGWRAMLSPEQLAVLNAARIVQPLSGYLQLTGRTASEVLGSLGYAVAGACDVDLERLGDLIRGERLFLSGDDYPESGVFHERYVECDPGALPGPAAVWAERRLMAKLDRARQALARVEAEHAALRQRHEELLAAHGAVVSHPAVRAITALRRSGLRGVLQTALRKLGRTLQLSRRQGGQSPVHPSNGHG